MAKRIIKQLSSRLTALPGTAVATGDTVENLTTGTLTLVRGKEGDVGSAKVVQVIEGSEIEVRPGETSAAITLGASEKVYALDTYDGGVSSTADKLFA